MVVQMVTENFPRVTFFENRIISTNLNSVMTIKTYIALALSLLFGVGPSIQGHSARLVDIVVENIGGPPYAMVCGKTKGEVGRKDLLNMKSIELGGCVSSAEVKSFEISVIREGSVVVLHADGTQLSDKMKELIRELPIGSKVYFEKIKVEDGTGKPYNIKPVVVTIG